MAHGALGAAGLVLITATPWMASAAETRPVVAVFGIEVRDLKLKPTVVASLTTYLATKLSESGAFKVVPGDQVKAAITARKVRDNRKQCYDQSCQVEIGKEVNASKSLSTQVMKVGTRCMVTTSLFDLRRATSDLSAVAKGGCTEDGITSSLDAVVAKLTGGNLSPPPARAPVQPPEPGSSAIKDPGGTFKPLLGRELMRAPGAGAQLTEPALAALRRLIATTRDDDPQKPDLLFRLAEHHRAMKRRSLLKARALDEPIRRAQSEGRKAQLQQEQKAHERTEHQLMLEALKTYLQIALGASYKRYPRLDEVLFNTADLLNQAKRQDKARAFFSQLIRGYPQSKHIPSAYLSFAEHYFDEGKLEEALKLFEQVAKYPGSPVHGYALYKQGWCWLNLKDARRALEKFVVVIRLGGASVPLVREARRSAVVAYASIGAPSKARAFFSRIGGAEVQQMIQQLAAIYRASGRSADARALE